MNYSHWEMSNETLSVIFQHWNLIWKSTSKFIMRIAYHHNLKFICIFDWNKKIPNDLKHKMHLIHDNLNKSVLSCFQNCNWHTQIGWRGPQMLSVDWWCFMRTNRQRCFAATQWCQGTIGKADRPATRAIVRKRCGNQQIPRKA